LDLQVGGRGYAEPCNGKIGSWGRLTIVSDGRETSRFLWRYGRGLAIDVAVPCGFLTYAPPCKIYAARQKHDRYDAGFKGSRYEFAAMVFETSGAVNVEGMNILRQIIRFASKRECVGNSSFAGEHGLEWDALSKLVWLSPFSTATTLTSRVIEQYYCQILCSEGCRVYTYLICALTQKLMNCTRSESPH